MRAVLVMVILVAGCVSSSTPAQGNECYEPLFDPAGGTPHLVLYWDLDGTVNSSGVPFDVQVFHRDVLVASGTTTTDCIVFDMGERKADRLRLDAELDGRPLTVDGRIDFDGTFLMIDVPV